MVVITFDTETTGLLKDINSRIVEIGAVRHDIESGEVIDTFQTLVRPGERFLELPNMDIPQKFCGISKEEILAAPDYVDAMESFIEWIGHRDVLYAWNLPFDSRMLMRYCKDAIGDCIHHDAIRWFSAFKWGGCWQRLYSLHNHRLAGRFPDGNLKTISMAKTIKYENWEGEQTHRALDDAILAAKAAHLVTNCLTSDLSL